jgi:integrase
MTIKTILWKHRQRKDKSFPIKVYVYDGTKVRYYPTGVHVLQKDWDKKNSIVRKGNIFSNAYNRQIQKMRMEVEHHFRNGGTHEEFIGEMEKEEKNSLISFIQEFLGEIQKGNTQLKPSTGQNYGSLLSRLQLFLDHKHKKDLLFDDINQRFYDEFVNFLMQKTNCTLAGAGKHIKNLKSAMNKALERKLHKNTAHLSKSFKVFRIEPNKIFLTEEEIAKIAELNLADAKELEREKDRFLLAYYLLLRFSDVRQLEKRMFFENEGRTYLRIKHQKTGNESILPVKKDALHLLEKYNYCFDFTANQVANRHLKTIAGMAGINEPTLESGKTLPKSKFVTTHTARRSAATNLYLQGVSLKTIADLGGWKSLKTLMIYLKASGMDTARIASELEFFR